MTRVAGRTHRAHFLKKLQLRVAHCACAGSLPIHARHHAIASHRSFAADPKPNAKCTTLHAGHQAIMISWAIILACLAPGILAEELDSDTDVGVPCKVQCQHAAWQSLS
jgi:hypothetical protein